MATEYLNDVRNELQSRSTRTTLDELKRKGLEQVRVIRSSQVLDLIEKAVERAFAKRGESADGPARAQLMQDSQQIFKEMLRSEMEQQRGTEVRAMQERLAEREAALAESRARQAELDAELRVLRQRASASSPEDLLDELRALRRDIGSSQATAAAPVQPAEPAVDGAIAKKLESLGAELSSQIERIGRKVGVGSTEETPVEIAGLFTSIPDLESNLDAVEAKERKGSDVSDALARMKSLRQGQGE
jgi:hypothetical protein